ncbi:MAG: restriction endonuclease [Micavibrio sp.]|nr:restriction endonuclease [Micavibrio sp.]
MHVYYPIAVHPDTHIREHSFDLKLNGLLERKRQLSRDMLIPNEDPADTANLFKATVGFSTEATGIDIDELDRMEPEEFEQWVLIRAGQSGYITDRTQRSHDHGADGIIQHKETGQKFILQCKHSKNEKISQDKVVEDLLRAREAYYSDAELVALSNSNFSASIIKRMNQLNIKHFDRVNITQWPRL